MSAFGNLFRHFMSYFFGRAAVLVAGLISLPLMTRLLTQEDYGLMNLVFLAITITSSLFALGFPQSTTRYFAEYATRGVDALKRFCSTMLFGVTAASAAAIAFLLVASLFLSHTDSFDTMAAYLQYAIILVLLRLVSSVCLQILRGNQQTLAFNLFNVANRYLSIGVIVILILHVYHDVTAVFVGTIVVEAIVMLVALLYLVRREFLGWVKPQTSEISRAIRFGMPLVFADLMVSLVASSDRFVIQYFLEADSVAVYSVAYDISDYVAIMFASPLQLAILPIVYSLWSKEGHEATRVFLNKTINLTLAVVIPMIAGFAIVGSDVVVGMASEKYAESGQIVPYVALGVMLGSIHFLLFTGLLLREKTRIITVLNAGAAFINLLLNIALVPRFGIVGAAYGTITTYAILDIVTYLVSRRYLRIDIDWMLVLKAVGATAFMAFAIWYLDSLSDYRIVNALLRTLIGASIWLLLMHTIEPSFRAFTREAHAKLIQRIRTAT